MYCLKPSQPPMGPNDGPWAQGKAKALEWAEQRAQNTTHLWVRLGWALSFRLCGFWRCLAEIGDGGRRGGERKEKRAYLRL